MKHEINIAVGGRAGIQTRQASPEPVFLANRLAPFLYVLESSVLSGFQIPVPIT